MPQIHLLEGQIRQSMDKINTLKPKCQVENENRLRHSIISNLSHGATPCIYILDINLWVYIYGYIL